MTHDDLWSGFRIVGIVIIIMFIFFAVIFINTRNSLKDDQCKDSGMKWGYLPSHVSVKDNYLCCYTPDRISSHCVSLNIANETEWL